MFIQSLTILLTLAAVAPGATPPLAPTGKWSLNYSENMCMLAHDFGDAKAPTTLGIRPLPLGEQTELVVMLPGALRTGRTGAATLTVKPGTAPAASVPFRQVPLPGEDRSVAQLRLPIDATPLLTDAAVVTIALQGSTTTSATLPPTKSALGALRKCQDELMGVWGVDPTERDRIAPDKAAVALPKGSAATSWILIGDYPSDALTKQGTALALWAVGTDGRVSDCKILQTSGVPSLDHATCTAIVKRGRYTPAMDKDGKPMVTHASAWIAWNIPPRAARK